MCLPVHQTLYIHVYSSSKPGYSGPGLFRLLRLFLSSLKTALAIFTSWLGCAGTSRLSRELDRKAPLVPDNRKPYPAILPHDRSNSSVHHIAPTLSGR